MYEPLLEVQHLKKYFKVGRNAVLHAVDNVSFIVGKGETLGLVGESGCGKTTVGRTILRLYEANGGKVLFHGKDTLAYKKGSKEQFALTQKMQIIFQDPYASLNPFFTVGEIIAEGLDIHGIGANKAERDEIAAELFEKVGLSRQHVNRFPHEFSGGQRQRVGVARALALNPEFIVCDEAISALDVSVQAQIINLLIDFREQMDLSYLFIAHDLSVVRFISDRIAVMYLGRIVEIGPSNEISEHPVHPYTVGLLNAIPVADPRIAKAQTYQPMEGELTSPVNPKPGCLFCSRCNRATPICSQTVPFLLEVGPGHFVACHNL